MTTLDRNLSRLPGNGGELRGFLESLPDPLPGYEIMSAASGEPTARFEGVYLHSPYAPASEARRLVEAELKGKPVGLCVFQGFGLGYQVEAFLSAFPESAAVVIEPDIPLFIEAMKHRDLSPILSSDRVKFLFNVQPQAVSGYLPENLAGELHVFKLRSLYARNKEYFQETDTAIKQYCSRKEINRNTLKRFGTLWVKNLVTNLHCFGSSRPVSSLAGVFKGIPAVVCAAGPSLDTILPVLPEIRERCLLIAVDTSLRGLRASGLSADFTVVVDPQYLNTRHIDRCGDHAGILVSESSTHPRVFRMVNGVRYFGGSLFPLGKRIEREIGSYGKLGAGGSVATSAWDLARILGCSPICMAGLDLSFPKNQTHYKGSFFEERAFSECARYLPVETFSFKGLNDAGPFRAPDNSGGTTLTDHRLILYKWWFESQMRLYPDTVTRTLSPHGLAISGMPAAVIAEILELPPARERIDGRIRELVVGSGNRPVRPDSPESSGGFEQHNDENSSRAAENEAAAAAPTTASASRILSLLDTLVSELQEVAVKAEEGLSLVAALEKSLSAGQPSAPLFSRLDLLDASLLSSDSLSLAGFIVQDIGESFLAGMGENPTLKEVLNRNRTIYQRIDESARFHLELFTRALEREKREK